MKIINISITLILLITLVIFFQNSTTTPKELLQQEQMQELHTTLKNITNTAIPYTNLYQTEPTFQNTMFNIAHGMTYAIITEINTILPLMIYLTHNTEQLTKWLITGALIITTLILLRSIVPIISIYFFIKEKRKYKEKVTD